MTIRYFTHDVGSSSVYEVGALSDELHELTSTFQQTPGTIRVTTSVTSDATDDTLIEAIAQLADEQNGEDPLLFGHTITEAFCQHLRMESLVKLQQLGVPQDIILEIGASNPTGWVLIQSRQSLRSAATEFTS